LCPSSYLAHLLVPVRLRELRVRLITLDPSQAYIQPGFGTDMRSLVNGLDVFLPSFEEARAFLSPAQPEVQEMAEAFASAGCRFVVIRRGAGGQFVWDRDASRGWLVPAYPARVKDLSGGGDSYCGGFLVGLDQTGDVVEAALRGSVSASLTIEGPGPLYALDTLPGLAQARLEAAASPAEEFHLLNLAYGLEQGLGRRDEALSVARRAATLAERAASPKERVQAVFRLAKALLYVGDDAEAVRRSQEAMRLGAELERRGAADAELKHLLADEESRLVNRMAGIGGREDEVDRAAESSVARWAAQNDPAGLAGALGMITEARLFQGRREDAVACARRALAATGYPQRTAGTSYALWAGALALCRLGDARTALEWTEASERTGREEGNPECVQEARLVHAAALGAAGRLDEGLRQIEQVANDVIALNMGGLTRWVALHRAWLRMKAGRPTPPEELQEPAEAKCGPLGAERLYALSHSLRRAGRDGQNVHCTRICE
jgi:tetratricopeptide (TPR) repeat protein